LALTFLRINGLVFTGRDLPILEETLALAVGEVSADYYADFLQANSRRARASEEGSHALGRLSSL
jgi:hypothetical protein